MKEEYYIDWINSLDINNCIFVNTIEDLYQSDNNILLNIIAIILNKDIEEILEKEQLKNLNYLNKISFLSKEYLHYNYDSNDEKNLKKNTILFIKFLKSKYPDNLNIIKERPKSSKNIKEKKYSLNNIIPEKLIFRNNINIKEESKNSDTNYINKTQIETNYLNNNEKKMEDFILNYLYKKGIINSEQK